MPKPLRLLRFLSVTVVLGACTAEPSDPGAAGRAARPDTTAPGPTRGRLYDRVVLFMTPRTDSAMVVPWLITARTRPGAVERDARAWLVRGGVWEAFFADHWDTPPTRVPWRLLPRGDMRLIVGESDAVERIVFQRGARHLETELGATLVEWNGRRGESYRVMEGATLLSNQRVEGLVLDISRVRRPEDPTPGDWIFLASGDSLQLFLSAPESQPPGTAGAYQGWALVGEVEFQWPRVSLGWTRTRAFERARRDVPVAWRARSSDGELVATLDVRSAQLQAGEGDGPLLPLEGLFEVEGTVRIGEQEYPVRGVHRHVQP